MAKLIIQRLSEESIEERGIRQWPVWEKEISRFPWKYDGDEECLIIEGEVMVSTGEGDFLISTGDFVIFRDGLECTWDIRKPIRKYYNFP